MSVRKLFVAFIFCMFCTQSFASPNQDKFMTVTGGIGCLAGWAFFAARSAPWGRYALAVFLSSNTVRWISNDVVVFMAERRSK